MVLFGVHVSHAEEKCLDMWPHCGVVTSLGHDVTWILHAVDVMEMDHTGSNGFMDMMVAQSIPSLGKLGVGNGGTCDNALIVTKHLGGTVDGHTKGTESETQNKDLFSGGSCSNKLTAIGGSLHLPLTLGKPVQWGLVQQMENSSA